MDFGYLRIAKWKNLETRKKEQILDVIKRVEKRTFPSNEALVFDQELKKRNTFLICVLEEEAARDRNELCAYMVYTRTKRVVLLHKLCVLETHRRKGVARWMLNELYDGMRKSGCGSIEIWVDEAREPAKNLYSSCGFVQVMKVENYYSPGRTGLKMIMFLQSQ